MKEVLRAHVQEMNEFKATGALPFKLENQTARLGHIEKSIMSIERNLKAHLDTFETTGMLKRTLTENVL